MMNEGLDACMDNIVNQIRDIPVVQSAIDLETPISEQELSELKNEAKTLDILPLADEANTWENLNGDTYEKFGPAYRDDIKDNPEFFYENGDLRWPRDRGFAGRPSVVTLEPGMRIDRYGSEDGRVTANLGTPYRNRSLPFVQGSQEYNVYEVVKPIKGVHQGVTAEAFNQPGGGIQQELPNSIDYYVENGHLRRL